MLVTSLLMLARKGFGIKENHSDPVLDVTIGDIPDIKTANPRYVDIAFFGAHDANTGVLGDDAPLEPASNKALKRFRPIIINYVKRYTKTQTVSIYELLRKGCRFLHIKVTRFRDDWYTSHSLITGELRTHILDILRFLGEHQDSGEIISILFQPIYMAEFSLADLHDFLASVKLDDKCLFDYVHYSTVDELHESDDGLHVEDLHYSDIVKGTNTGLVLFERRDQHYNDSWDARTTKYPFFFDMDQNAMHVWYNHSNPDLIDRDMNHVVKKIDNDHKLKNKLRMNQTQAAHTFKSFKDALSAMYEHSLLKIAEKHNIKIISRPDFEKVLKAMPVFQVDFLTSDYGRFNEKANKLIRQFNEKLVKSLLPN